MRPHPLDPKRYPNPDVVYTNRCWVSQDQSIAFLPYTRGGAHGKQYTLYMKVNPCVIFCVCHYCGAKKGQLCRGSGGPPTIGTHTARRMAYNMFKRREREKRR